MFGKWLQRGFGMPIYVLLVWPWRCQQHGQLSGIYQDFALEARSPWKPTGTAMPFEAVEVTGERLKGGLAGGRPLIVDGEVGMATKNHHWSKREQK